MALDPAAPAHEAIVAILLMAMVSDGDVKPLEAEVLHAALNRSRSLSCLSEKSLRALEARDASSLSEVSERRRPGSKVSSMTFAICGPRR